MSCAGLPRNSSTNKDQRGSSLIFKILEAKSMCFDERFMFVFISISINYIVMVLFIFKIYKYILV